MKPIRGAPGGTISGSAAYNTGIAFHAEFLNDEDHSPSCCEVRQLISWTQGARVNHHGWDASNAPRGTGDFQPGQWYEDRSPTNCRYGRRNAPFNCLGPGNNYSGNNYDGIDYPHLVHHALLGFRLIVVDVCNGGKTIYTSKTVHVQF